jgi:outer membrane protein assembly factor BamD
MLKPTRTVILLLACAAILPATGCARNRTKGDTAYDARDVSSL